MKFYIIIILLSFSLYSTAQDKTSINSHYDILFDSYDQAIVMYNIDENHTVYKASKIFHQSVDKILSYNNILSPNEIERGRRIGVPIDFQYVFRGTDTGDFKNTKFIPLYYNVKPKETLYRIAKTYCQEDLKDMMVRNNLTSKNLDIGQKLILGWLAFDKKTIQQLSEATSNAANKSDIKDKQQKLVEVSPESIEENLSTSDVLDENIQSEPLEIDSIALLAPSVDFKQESGIAIWKKSSKGHSKFALHQTAKINSEIELYNPLVHRTVKAKVIGRIPKGAYNEDVSVIISPATAVSLGALDHRFKVTMTYEESL